MRSVFERSHFFKYTLLAYVHHMCIWCNCPINSVADGCDDIFAVLRSVILMSKITKSILFILISPDELSFFSALVYIPIVDIRMAPSKNVWKIWEEQQISEQGTTG